MPGTLRALRKLGITITEDEGYPFEGIRFVDSAHQVEARFPDGTGIGLRRTHLHRRMHEHAANMGTNFAWGSHAKLTPDGKVFVDDREMHFRWLIGADGTASSVRKWANLEASSESSRRFGFRRHYRVAPWSPHVEIHWAPSGQVYVTPVAPDQICLVFISRNGRVNRENFLEAFPQVLQRLKGATLVTDQRAALSATRRLKHVTRDSVTLIGDASGSVDAIIGVGLAMTFQQATALATSIEEGSLSSYSKAHAEIGKRPHAMSRLMLLMDRWSMLQRHALGTLSGDETLFRDLLAVHGDSESLQRFALRRGPEFGWNLLTNFCKG